MHAPKLIDPRKGLGYSYCVPLLFSIMALLLLVVACGSKNEAVSTQDEPDRLVLGPEDSLVLGLEDTSFRNLALDDRGSGEMDNATLIRFSAGEPEHRAYIERLVAESRRITGYQRFYRASSSNPGSAGPLYFTQAVDVFPDEKGAQAFVHGLDAEPSNKGRVQQVGLVIISDEPFEPQRVGDESAGRMTVLETKAPDGVTSFRPHQTQLTFQRGHLVGYVSVHYTDDRDARDEVTEIAKKLDKRMAEFLKQ